MTIVDDGGTPDVAVVAQILSAGARTYAQAAALSKESDHDGTKILDGLRRTHREVKVSREFFEKATAYRQVTCNLERQLKAGILTDQSKEAQQKLLQLADYFLNVAVSINPLAYNQVETLLNLPFFQLMESRYLETAKTTLAAINPSNNDDKVASTRLDLLYTIIRLTLLEPDASNSRQLLLDRFTSYFPKDPWVDMLNALLSFRENSYSSALKALDKLYYSPGSFLHQETVLFFRGLCYLNLYKQDLSITTATAHENAYKAKASFEKVTDLIKSNKGHGAHYNELALSSAFIFHGIVNFYQKDLISAIKDFEEAERHSTGALKARALNDIGYMHFVLGNLKEAEIALVKATEKDPNFPYAWSNLGYVKMAAGDSPRAKKIFLKNVKNKVVQIESRRDVILAQLALAHLMEEDRKPVSQILEAYEKVIAELNLPDFFSVSESLRLAYIHHFIGKQVYLDTRYQGLEVLALSMFAKSFFEASAILDKNPQETHARRILQQAQKDYETTKKLVDPAWFRNTHASRTFGIIRKPLVPARS